MPPGHGVSTGATPPPTHTGAPLAHEIVPRAQGPPPVGVHVAPGVHGTHVPVDEHTLVGPHIVPAGAMPVAVHVAAPDAHVICPVLHGVDSMHAAPFEQGMHAPIPLHTVPSPHATPAATKPVATHCATLSTHRRSPIWHAAGVHGPLAMQTPESPSAASRIPVSSSAPSDRASKVTRSSAFESGGEATSSSLPGMRGSKGAGEICGEMHVASSPQVSPCSSQRRAMVHGSGVALAQPTVEALQRVLKNTRACNERRGIRRNRSDRVNGARVRSTWRSSIVTVTCSSRAPPSKGTTVNDPGNRATAPSPSGAPRRTSLQRGRPPPSRLTQKRSTDETLSGRSVSTVTTTCVGSNTHALALVNESTTNEHHRARAERSMSSRRYHRQWALALDALAQRCRLMKAVTSERRCTFDTSGSARRRSLARAEAPRGRR